MFGNTTVLRAQEVLCVHVVGDYLFEIGLQEASLIFRRVNPSFGLSHTITVTVTDHATGFFCMP